MNYHTIRTDDMLNGSGLRVVVFLSGCPHRCDGCHNPETWDVESGKLFTKDTAMRIVTELSKDYISGITLTGGDPLYKNNVLEVYALIKYIKKHCPNKSIWLYTGYKWRDINNDKMKLKIASLCDVICDGEFVKSLADVNLPWVGSSNQRVIDVQKSIKENKIVLYKGDK